MNEIIEIQQSPSPFTEAIQEVEHHYTVIANDIIDDETMGPYEKLTLLVLLRYKNNATQTAWPSIQTLCAKTGASRSTVIRSLKSLEEQGHIKKQERYTSNKQTSNLITFPAPIKKPQTTKASPPPPKMGERPTGNPAKETVSRRQHTHYNNRQADATDRRPKLQFFQPLPQPKFDLAKHKIHKIAKDLKQQLHETHTAPQTANLTNTNTQTDTNTPHTKQNTPQRQTTAP